MQLEMGQTDYALEHWRGYDDSAGLQPRSASPIVATILLIVGGMGGGLAYFLGQPLMGAIIFGAVATISIAVYPLLGLFLVAASFALDGWLQLSAGAFTAGKAFAGVTGLAFLFRLWRKPIGYYFQARPLRAHAFLVALFLLHLVVFMGSWSWLAGLMETSVIVLMFALAFIVGGIPESLSQLRKVCMVSTITGGLLGLSIVVFGVESFGHRSAQRLYTGINENLLAYTLGIGLFASGIAWYKASKGMKIAIVILDLLAMVAIGLSGSRAVWLALAVAILVAALFMTRIPLKYRIGFPAVVIIIGVLGHLAIEQIAPERADYLVTRITSIGEGESSGRTEYIWPAYWEAFLDDPVAGVGPGAKLTLGFEAHNDLLRAMGSLGLPGMLIFIWLVVTLIRDAYRNVVPWLRLVSLGMIVFALVYGMTHTTLFQKPLAFAIGLMACMANLGMCPKRGTIEGGAYLTEADIEDQLDSPGLMA